MSAATDPYLIKLVRDKVKQSFEHPEHELTYMPVSRGELAQLLRRKLLEEAAEYLLDPSRGELADIAEICRGLARHDLGIPWADVEDVRIEKRRSRGGFDRGIGMYATVAQ